MVYFPMLRFISGFFFFQMGVEINLVRGGKKLNASARGAKLRKEVGTGGNLPDSVRVYFRSGGNKPCREWKKTE
jgi:hypothetical protein